ncbi:hypothetical protein EDB84DRAFT_1440734 [Lactarius hengduanensis]|nr:hypothetical protein EDB84DRAFT_1440734 [Lactarius hengduanensis]
MSTRMPYAITKLLMRRGRPPYVAITAGLRLVIFLASLRVWYAIAKHPMRCRNLRMYGAVSRHSSPGAAGTINTAACGGSDRQSSKVARCTGDSRGREAKTGDHDILETYAGLAGTLGVLETQMGMQLFSRTLGRLKLTQEILGVLIAGCTGDARGHTRDASAAGTGDADEDAGWNAMRDAGLCMRIGEVANACRGPAWLGIASARFPRAARAHGFYD